MICHTWNYRAKRQQNKRIIANNKDEVHLCMHQITSNTNTFIYTCRETANRSITVCNVFEIQRLFTIPRILPMGVHTHQPYLSKWHSEAFAPWLNCSLWILNYNLVVVSVSFCLSLSFPLALLFVRTKTKNYCPVIAERIWFSCNYFAAWIVHTHTHNGQLHFSTRNDDNNFHLSIFVLSKKKQFWPLSITFSVPTINRW